MRDILCRISRMDDKTSQKVSDVYTSYFSSVQKCIWVHLKKYGGDYDALVERAMEKVIFAVNVFDSSRSELGKFVLQQVKYGLLDYMLEQRNLKCHSEKSNMPDFTFDVFAGCDESELYVSLQEDLTTDAYLVLQLWTESKKLHRGQSRKEVRERVTTLGWSQLRFDTAWGELRCILEYYVKIGGLGGGGLGRLSVTLYPYQVEAVGAIERFNGRVLMAYEQGTGKTVCAIKYIIDNALYPAVVICPATLKFNWQREFWNHFGKRADVISGGKVYSLRVSGNPVYIVNYDVLSKWEDKLKELEPQIIVCDESQAIKNMTAARTKVVLRLGDRVPHILALSGTPMMNHPTELFSTLRLVMGKNGIESRKEFCDRYSKLVLTRWGYKYEGSRNLQELHERLSKMCMIRKLLRDVLPELPDKTRQVVPVELPSVNMREYYAMQSMFMEWYSEKFPDKAAVLSQAALIVTKLGYMKRKVAEWKLPLVFDWIDAFLENSDAKLVVFGLHTNIIDAIVARYAKKGNARHPFVVKVDGSVSLINRQRAVDLFQTNANTRIFVGQMRAAGVGLTLTAAHNVLFAECDFVPAVHQQAESRCLRIGAKNHVLCTYIVAANTIEEHVVDILYRKQQEFDAVIDGGKDVDSFNIIQELMRRVRNEKFSKLGGKNEEQN